jgi:prepilin-type N-terminal cleavage/methylation domain-containing protein
MRALDRRGSRALCCARQCTRGFTLIELLIVFTIIGFLGALVAPFGIHQVEKARSQSEWLMLERTMEGLAFRAFAQGREVDLTADGAGIEWRIGTDAPKTLALQQLFFSPKQMIHIDAHGLASPDTLTLNQAGRPRTIILNRWLTDAK